LPIAKEAPPVIVAVGGVSIVTVAVELAALVQPKPFVVITEYDPLTSGLNDALIAPAMALPDAYHWYRREVLFVPAAGLFGIEAVRVPGAPAQMANVFVLSTGVLGSGCGKIVTALIALVLPSALIAVTE
jgi:hypothetical protein